LYRDGKLGAAPVNAMKLLPVSLVEDEEPLRPELSEAAPSSSGTIHIELPGEIRLSLEGALDPDLVRAVLQSLRA
jgi:hypothetical protein